jgi:hypothetical protein
VNLGLEGLVTQCVPGAKILDLCEFGHTVMEAQANKLYTKKVAGKTIDRGVAFPVCISVNDVVCNHSPLPTEETVSCTFLLLSLDGRSHVDVVIDMHLHPPPHLSRSLYQVGHELARVSSFYETTKHTLLYWRRRAETGPQTANGRKNIERESSCSCSCITLLGGSVLCLGFLWEDALCYSLAFSCVSCTSS